MRQYKSAFSSTLGLAHTLKELDFGQYLWLISG